MKVLGISGSPRKNGNTASLLNKALEGAAAQGAETEIINLYELNFKGCKSCFACKTRDGKSYGKCAIKDDLTPVLAKVEEVDAIVLGSPVYFGTVTGEMSCFLERLLFPYLTYLVPPKSLFPKKIKTGLIFTMNANEKIFEKMGYTQSLGKHEMSFKMFFGSSESLYCYDTVQFEDYSKIVADRFDPAAKAKRREEVFPEDCAKAFEMGARLAGE